MEDRIIPFGKYKGKPLEILAADKDYLDWLTSQSWFKEKYTNIYNIVVINNFREPNDTPEHNRIQVRFLKPEVRLKLAYLVNKDMFKRNSSCINEELRKKMSELDGDERNLFLNSLKNIENNDDISSFKRSIVKYSNPNFETIDVSYTIWYGFKFHYDCKPQYSYLETTGRPIDIFGYETQTNYKVEIKPTISDDFPAVLRQMKAAMPIKRYANKTFYILLIGSYTGLGATEEEFIQYFNSQGYYVVFEKQLNEIRLPESCTELRLDEDIQNMLKKLSNDNEKIELN